MSSVHLTGKKLLLPDPMILKAIWPEYEGFSLRCLLSARRTFGQNMKRGYEGESIPSQSLARQDKRVQQMNSHENGKTYSMKMLPKGTTSTPANEDKTRAENQVASDDAPISTFDKEGVEGTISPSLANTRSKTSDAVETPDCPIKVENLEDFFARVSGQIKRAQSLGFSADQSSNDKISATQKPTPSAEMLATAKGDIERVLNMPSENMLLPENCLALSAALSIYAAAPDVSAERALALEKLKENLPHFSLTLRRVMKDKEEYFSKAAKKTRLIDALIKDQELYTDLKDCRGTLDIQISKLVAKMKDAQTKIKAIEEQKLSLAKRCFKKSSVLDKVEAEFQSLKELKELADSDAARVEENLKYFKSKII